MRAYEFLSKQQLDEGGESGPTRYNTELALCFAFAGRTAGLSKEQLQLGNSKTTLANILKNQSLNKHLDSGIKETASDLLITQDKLVTTTKGDKGKINFDKWVGIGCDHYDRIARDLEKVNKGDKMPTKFGWVAGENAGGVADISFIGEPEHRLSGVSLKAASGITLSNMTPKRLGLEGEFGIDMIQTYAQWGSNKFIDFKQSVMKACMDDAEFNQPGETLMPGTRKDGESNGRTIRFNPSTAKPQDDTQDDTIDQTQEPVQPQDDTIDQTQEAIQPQANNDIPPNTFTVDTKGKLEHWTREKILEQAGKNAKWQRVFGDWYQANSKSQATVKGLIKPLTRLVSRRITKIMEKHLKGDDLKGILQFENKPYYYANNTNIYYVPAIDSQSGYNLKLWGLKFGEPDGTSMLWYAYIGRDTLLEDLGVNRLSPQMREKHCAAVHIYLRYRNGLFETNSTADVQSLTNPGGLAWIPVDD